MLAVARRRPRSMFSDASAKTTVLSLTRHEASKLTELRGTLVSGRLSKNRPRNPVGPNCWRVGWLEKKLAVTSNVTKSTLRCRPGDPRYVCHRCRRASDTAD